MVIDYNIVDTGDGFHLNVASTPMKGDKDVEVFQREVERTYRVNEAFEVGLADGNQV